VLADAFGLRPAILAVAALTALSGVVVAVRMYETHPRRAPAGPAGQPPLAPSSLAG
jgi:dienelactone hydrolase